MINPYLTVNWNNLITIPSVSHAHSRNAQRTMNLVNLCVPNLGNKIHLNLSNYHGSYPLYPLTDLASIHYNEKREWCRQRGSDTNPNHQVEQLARLEADHSYIPIHLQQYKDGIDLTKIIECPNAEHHRFLVNGNNPQRYNRWHMNSIGSTYGDGHSPMDVEGELTEIIGNGSEIEWTVFLNNVFDNLLYPDGGGITINHPNWTGDHNPVERILTELDYDERVLGIEIYNDGDRDTDRPLYADNYLEPILLTGRRCWLFACPDHMHETQHPNDWRGVNVLFVNAETNYDCLKAYRDGTFYAKIIPNSDLKFTYINYANEILSVETTNATKITLIIDGQSKEYNTSTLSTIVEKDKHIYVRIKAETDDPDDYIFSNPIMLNGNNNNNSNNNNNEDMFFLFD